MSKLPASVVLLAASSDGHQLVGALPAPATPMFPLANLTGAEIESAITKLAAQEGKVDDESSRELMSESQFMKLMTGGAPAEKPSESNAEPCGDGDCGVCCDHC